MKFRNLIHKAFIATCIGLSVLAFSSCSSTYFQVVNLSYSDNVKISGNNLSSQNEDLEILYNFWGNGLFMRFDLINKTDKEIFIILPQSFYIKNDFAVPYSESRETSSNTTAAMVTSSAAAVTTTTQRNQTFANPQFACIPPHSFITIGSYAIITERFTDCNPNNSFPKKSHTADFKQNDSPLCLKNRITYSFNRDFSDTHYIENIFFVSSFTNSEGKNTEVEIPACDYSVEKSETIEQPIQEPLPNMFYIKYDEQSPKYYDEWDEPNK